MKKSQLILAGLLLLALGLIPTSALAAQNLKSGIHFLNDVSKVDWYKIDGRHIIIGWKGSLSEDFYSLNTRTAQNASRFILNRVYVWAVPSHKKDWEPGEGGHICITTAAKSGSIKTNCRK
jgi:hypothetical protein